MTAVPNGKLTPAEYLAIERTADFNSEFLNGEMFAMAGASRPHKAIKDSLIGELHSRFKGGPCQTFSSDMRVKVPETGLCTYPDIVVVCEPPELEDEILDTLLNPRIIIDVLSDSTAKYDRGAKYRHYQRIASLQENVIVSQDEPAVERLSRQADGNWLSKTYEGLDSQLELATLPIQIPMADIYAHVSLPDNPTR